LKSSSSEPTLFNGTKCFLIFLYGYTHFLLSDRGIAFLLLLAWTLLFDKLILLLLRNYRQMFPVGRGSITGVAVFWFEPVLLAHRCKMVVSQLKAIAYIPYRVLYNLFLCILSYLALFVTSCHSAPFPVQPVYTLPG
jgi:hypothetical protein